MYWLIKTITLSIITSNVDRSGCKMNSAEKDSIDDCSNDGEVMISDTWLKPLYYI